MASAASCDIRAFRRFVDKAAAHAVCEPGWCRGNLGIHDAGHQPLAGILAPVGESIVHAAAHNRDELCFSTRESAVISGLCGRDEGAFNLSGGAKL